MPTPGIRDLERHREETVFQLGTGEGEEVDLEKNRGKGKKRVCGEARSVKEFGMPRVNLEHKIPGVAKNAGK